MKVLFALATFAVNTKALISRGSSCCFHLNSGSSSVGQLSDGQNRLDDSSLTPAEFCLSSDGTITDAHGRGCILTPPTTQFQCDEGATPTSGFSINSSGELEFNNNPDFVACQADASGALNIYTTESSAVTHCSTVTLTADSCASSSSGSSTRTTCGTTLISGSFEFPHLIIPINSASPDTASGTSFNGEVTSTISSIFNFDIPPSDSGKTCSLVFLFPEKADLQTSSFTFSGDGKVNFSELSKAASSSTTFSNAPFVSNNIGDVTISPGHSYVISTFSCPAGQAIAFEMKNAGTTNLDYFQDFNPSP
ncbi:uncharacterized protein N7483_004865 [Penicillium malachiteum]|uniref:uncharacterized protein n=1 Tax=Penicillium malachiteum TaxID=1324776 RepID=UPI002549C0A5|nr:uncharacterized protein N7483_004865 [Penicillium malachiteum]KAJ5730357.1 hypothetical protein N7483_004865 [Penicillium malachiteum]